MRKRAAATAVAAAAAAAAQVARPQVEFSDLKRRMKARLDKLGIEITKVHEEEYCLIPMGGVLPSFPQRTLGIGGTAGMVHPSTGYAPTPRR
jgi:lycopene beta-cyclase